MYVLIHAKLTDRFVILSAVTTKFIFLHLM